MSESQDNGSRPDENPDHAPKETHLEATHDFQSEVSAEGENGKLWTRSFVGLVITQFLGALNDNMFRWLIIPIGKEIMEEGGKATGNMSSAGDIIALAWGLACFVAPAILLAVPAGFVADRFSKRSVIVWCKVAEIVIMGLGIAAILFGNFWFMLVVLFLMGSQSAMFSPSKYGSIPEIVPGDRIAAANGVVQMLTMVAIILGTLAGGVLYNLTEPAGKESWWIYATALIGVAAIGFFSSLLIKWLPVANPQRQVPLNVPKALYKDLSLLVRSRPLFMAALAYSFFWGIGSLIQMNVDQFASRHLYVEQAWVGPLLGLLSIGIGSGAVFAGYWSKGRIELGLVSYGAMGMALFCSLMVFVPMVSTSVDVEDSSSAAAIAQAESVAPVNDVALTADQATADTADTASAVPSVEPKKLTKMTGSYLWTCFLLLMLGFVAGLYMVPLEAFLQHESDVETRGTILASTNVLCSLAMFLSAGIYFVLGDPSWLALTPAQVFLVCGLFTIPLMVVIVYNLQLPTTRVIVTAILKMTYRVRVEGLENVPRQGGAILTPNHVSYLDAIMIGMVLPRHVRMIAWDDNFTTSALRWFARICKVIEIDPESQKSIFRSLREARSVLQNGELTCIFPEGEITRTGELQEFMPGYSVMQKKTDAPIIPVYVEGLWGSIFSFSGGKFFWKMPKGFRIKVTIRFGEPITGPVSPEDLRGAVMLLAGDGANSSGNEAEVG